MTRTATTRAVNSCRATCSLISSARRSSSPTTTRSSRVIALRSQKAAVRCSRDAAKPSIPSKPTGQMLQRVMPELMGMKNILAINDEAHHCYREKPGEDQEGVLKGRREERGREEQGSSAALDFRSRSGESNTWAFPCHRSFRDAVFSERFRLCRGHTVPLDDE